MATPRTPGKTRTGELVNLLIVAIIVLALEIVVFALNLPWTMLIFLVAVVFAIFVFVMKPLWAVLILFANKPILDIMWGASFGGIKGTYVTAVGAVALWLVAMLYFRINPLSYANGRVMLIWAVAAILPLFFSFFTNIHSGLMGGTAISVRYVNGWGFYFLFAFLIRRKKDADALANAWLISAAVPVAIGLFYLLSGDPAGYQHTLGWDRLKGPYHDAAAFMIEIGPALPLLFYKTHKAKRVWKKILWLGLLAVWFILAFKSYTRAWWIISALTAAIWIIGGVFQPALGLAAGAAWKWKEIWRRFTTSGIEDLSSGRAFGGRMWLWERFFNEFWSRFSPMEKVVGIWSSVRNFTWVPDFHNQYLLVLAHMGLVGLLSYVSMLIGFGFSLVRSLLSTRKAEALLGLSALIMVIFAGFSGRFMEVPNSQWFFFSIMGMCLAPELIQAQGKD